MSVTIGGSRTPSGRQGAGRAACRRGRARRGLPLASRDRRNMSGRAPLCREEQTGETVRLERPGGDRDRRQRRHRPRHGEGAGGGRRRGRGRGARSGEERRGGRRAGGARRQGGRGRGRRHRRGVLPGDGRADASTRFGRLDILVNNAGTNVRKQPEEYTPRGVAHDPRDQSHQRVPVQPGGLSRDEAGGRRQDHHDRLDDVDLRRVVHRALRRDQGRHRAARQGARAAPGPRTTSRSTRCCPAGSIRR